MVKRKRPATPAIATRRSNRKHNDPDACLKDNFPSYEETNPVDEQHLDSENDLLALGRNSGKLLDYNETDCIKPHIATWSHNGKLLSSVREKKSLEDAARPIINSFLLKNWVKDIKFVPTNEWAKFLLNDACQKDAEMNMLVRRIQNDDLNITEFVNNYYKRVYKGISCCRHSMEKSMKESYHSKYQPICGTTKRSFEMTILSHVVFFLHVLHHKLDSLEKGSDNVFLVDHFPGTLDLTVLDDEGKLNMDGPYLHPEYRRYSGATINNDEFIYFLEKILGQMRPGLIKFQENKGRNLLAISSPHLMRHMAW